MSYKEIEESKEELINKLEVIIKEKAINELKPFFIPPQIFITPVGWSYGANENHSLSLTLAEAMLGVKHRQKTVPIDRIYSVLGLLSYGNKVPVSYKPWGEEYYQEEIDNKLAEVISIAVQEGYGKETPLNWSGHGSNISYQEMSEDKEIKSKFGQKKEINIELLEAKKNQLKLLINFCKSKLKKSYHGYLEAFLEENSKVAEKKLLEIIDPKTLQGLSKKQQEFKDLEKLFERKQNKYEKLITFVEINY